MDLAVLLSGTGLSKAAIPFVTAEDILLAKLHWFREGGGLSEVQWRDIDGIVRSCLMLDRAYLERGAARLEVLPLLKKARES